MVEEFNSANKIPSIFQKQAEGDILSSYVNKGNNNTDGWAWDNFLSP